ncbi:hypothetical protein ACMAZF_20440 (plasmid) [Psychrobium sp. nBUS_13]|uniref:hypothetical protein n=1 Tax=Psychrobium sp. nBUS_13 TaxID=3395319 RepID=UPI003EBC6CAB
MKKITLISTILIASGCSSIADKQADIANEAIEQRLEQLKDSLAQVPDWYLEVPKPDATGVYGVGFGEANKVHYSLKLSEQRAKFDLATQIKQVFTGQDRTYEQLNTDADLSSQSTSLIDAVVDSVPLSGVERVKREVFVVGTKVHAYSLLKMPYSQYNKLLSEAQSIESNSAMDAAFEKMYSQINKQKVKQAK